MIILGIILGVVMLAMFGYLFYLPRMENRRVLTSQQSKNKKREKHLVDYLLKDIKENTDQWFIQESGFGNNATMINDHKSIGISYVTKTITIFLNLESLTEFDQKTEDTVKINITGDHVAKFINEAEYIIDKRGKEIDFFRSELENRL